MKNSISSLKKIASITGLFLGAFAISVAAATWTPPNVAPPDGNIDAPINAGASVQGKIGKLGLGAATPRAGTQVLDVIGSALIDNVVTNTLTVVTNAGAGKVLTSDASGAATWQTNSSTGGLIFSPVVSINSKSSADIGPSSRYSACFLTKNGISSSGNANGSCEVFNDGTNWVVKSTDGANDTAFCSAQCMKFVSNPIVASCSTNVTSVNRGGGFGGGSVSVTWTAVASGGNGTYNFVWSGDSVLNPNTGATPSKTVTYASGGPKTMSVAITSSGETKDVSCTNSSGGASVQVN